MSLRFVDRDMYSMLLLRISVFLCLATYAVGKLAEESDERLRFPSNFLLGAATSAYQVEGAWNVSGKGESVWDRIAHANNGRVRNNDTGDVAANSYYKYKEDVAILKKLGFKSYRFSLSWTRILPTGLTNKISQDGVAHYHNFIDELLANDIEPIVTIWHFDHPQTLEDAGGWLNSEMIQWFADYARLVYREYGSKVKRFIPLNEPQIYCKYSYSYDDYIPRHTFQGIGEYLCVHNMLKAHARAYRIYEQEFKKRQRGEIGVLLNLNGYIPKRPNEEEAAEISFQFNAGWTLHPIYYGDYPPVMKQLVANRSLEQGYERSRLPEFDAQWIEYIRGTADFLALNHYTSRIVEKGHMGSIPSHDDDQNVRESLDRSWKSSSAAWLKVVPEGFRICLRKLAKSYGNPPIYITENGFPDHGVLDDDDRIDYYREYLRQMLLAIHEDGVNVRGYLLWSFLDTFEWAGGYSDHFGIVSVDFDDPERPRTLKKSALWWQKVIAAGKIDEKI